MPLYEYQCTQCKRHTEKRQKFSDPEITICPHCGGLLERVLSAPAIAFKGGGWYKDGYGSSAPQTSKPKTDSESPAVPAGSSSGSSSSEAPATSTSSTPAPAPSTPAAAAATTSTSSSEQK